MGISNESVLPTVPPVPGSVLPAVPPVPGARPQAGTGSFGVPGYEMLGELGRGGMGVVYKARQARLGRTVALKMILSGSYAGAEQLARFKTEAETIARLQHPNIVQVHEVGECEDKPYFSLEFCEGGSLDRKAAGNPLPPKQAAKLTETLARAMGAAHQANVIHRDLKPANVLLTADGTPKITDFGLAKKLDEQGQTQTGAVMGTPSYMAPEQAKGKKDIGPAADIYALGAILYDLLTGRPPFKAATTYETLVQVVFEEPVPPRRLNAKVPHDLETVCLKCLQKDPVKRYATAGLLADDLERFVAGKPIHARPVGRAERLVKWARREPMVAGLVALVAITLLLGASVGTGFGLLANNQAKRADGEAKRANEAAEKAEREAGRATEKAEEASREAKEKEKQRARADQEAKQAKAEAHKANVGRHGFQMTAAWQAWQQGDVIEAETLLMGVPPEFQQTWEYRHLRELCRRKAMPLLGPNDVHSVAFSPDGKRIVSGSWDNTVKVWEAGAGQDLLFLKGHANDVTGVAFSPDGKRVFGRDRQGKILAWDALTGHQLPDAPSTIPAEERVAIHGSRRASAEGCLVRIERIPASGEWERLSPEEKRNHRILQARASQEFHSTEAESAEINDEPFAAVFHLDRLRMLLPTPRPKLLARRNAVLTAAMKANAKNSWAVCTLARQAISNPRSVPGRKSLLPGIADLAKQQQDARMTCLYGGLLLRTGSIKESIAALQAGIAKRDPNAPPVAELLLSLAHIKLKQRAQARKHWQAAVAWIDGGPLALQAASLAGLGRRGPFAVLGSLAVVPSHPSLNPLDFQTAHELKTLRAEVEKALAGQR